MRLPDTCPCGQSLHREQGGSPAERASFPAAITLWWCVAAALSAHCAPMERRGRGRQTREGGAAPVGSGEGRGEGASQCAERLRNRSNLGLVCLGKVAAYQKGRTHKKETVISGTSRSASGMRHIPARNSRVSVSLRARCPGDVARVAFLGRAPDAAWSVPTKDFIQA